MRMNIRLVRYTTFLTSTTVSLFRTAAFSATSTAMTSRSVSSARPATTAARTALEESGKDGAFVRKDSAYRDWVTRGE